jgi:hypothetical protein
VRDILLLVLGAALAVEEWRYSHAERRQAAAALVSIRAELVDNQGRVERARAHHLEMADTLSAYRARYRALGDALTHAIMVDLQHRGVEPVFRDDFANFIPVERDFAQREQVLASDYARTIAQVDSAR